MKNTSEKSSDEIKEESQSENKMDDNSQNSSINLNKNKMENIYKLLDDDDYYSISQNLNKNFYSKDLNYMASKLNIK